jgi:tetratricopeptide (TPR) repeat protein
VEQPETGGLEVVDAIPNRPLKLANIVLLEAYGQLSQQDPQYRQRYLDTLTELGRSDPHGPLVEGALGEQALAEGRAEDAVTHLKLALPKANASIYLALGQALAKLGRSDEAIEYLRKGVAANPYDAVMQKTLILQYINQKSYTEAHQLMEQYVQTFPEDSFMRNLLARVSVNQ